MASNLERVTRQAQETADREGRPMIVINLNRYSPLYVIRDADSKGDPSRIVATVQPKAPPPEGRVEP
jgi:hypothetical protein